jgi:hypothetical protein
MRTLANLIILSLLASMAGLSKAATELVDPTRPANYIDPVEETPVQQDSEQQEKEPGKLAKTEQIPDYRLNAIKIGRSSRLAIINGESVLQGEKIGDAMLVKINSYSVVMNIRGKEITVSLLPDSIKTRSTKQVFHRNYGKYDEDS